MFRSYAPSFEGAQTRKIIEEWHATMMSASTYMTCTENAWDSIRDPSVVSSSAFKLGPTRHIHFSKLIITP